MISFVVDGRLCDGGDFRQFGWGRFSPHLRHANGSQDCLSTAQLICYASMAEPCARRKRYQISAREMEYRHEKKGVSYRGFG